MIFPTGKPHVSYSEVKTWKECSWRHKLIYVDKIDMFKPSPNIDFGTLVHAECEEYLEKRTFNLERLENAIRKTWEEKKFGSPDSWIKEANQILEEIPAFLDEQFPDWKFVAAEQELYESIEGSTIKFKGFVDGMIQSKNKRNQERLWLIDWKTTSARGWSLDKKKDFLVQAQLALYKHFTSQKFEIDPKEIKCGFVLLKRGAKKGNACELFEISVGPKTLENSNKLVSSMIKNVANGKPLKNRSSCTYCDFKGTQHCLGSGEYPAFTSSK
jgi:hypothetical protein